MRNVKRLGAMAVAIAIVAALAAPVLASEYTVGQLVQRLAKEMNLNATDQRIAAESLAVAGVQLPSGMDYRKGLTEADMVEIARSVGLQVSTTRPDSSFDSGQVDRFFLTFAGELGGRYGDDNSVRNGETPDGESGGAPGNGPAFDPYSKGKGGAKGKKKGHRSPTEPE